jgi:hypothetical protein
VLNRTTRFEIRNTTSYVELESLLISFNPRTQWLAQTVVIDAKKGIYDYLRGRVLLAPGPNSYVINGVNFDTATPLATKPIFKLHGMQQARGEVDISLAMIKGLDLLPPSETPNLEDLIRPEDLKAVWHQQWSNQVEGETILKSFRGGATE